MTRDILKAALPTKLLHRGTIANFETIFFLQKISKNKNRTLFLPKNFGVPKKTGALVVEGFQSVTLLFPGTPGATVTSETK